MRTRKDHAIVAELCLTAATLTEVEARLGLTSPNTCLRKYIRHHGFPMPCYLGKAAGCKLSEPGRLSRGRRVTLADLREGVLLTTASIKRLLFRNGLKAQACERCGWCERRESDGKIPLHLHHKNGNTEDCRLENLEILCPNHHALTENYCGCNGHRNLGRWKIHEKRQALYSLPLTPCEVCGRPCYGQQFCSNKCRGYSSRLVPRPTTEQLAEDIRTLSWLAIGRKYGVSDNAVRKWARACGLLSAKVNSEESSDREATG